MKFKTELLEDSYIQLIDGDRGKNYPKQADFGERGHCLFLSAKNVTSSGFEFLDTSFISSEKDELLRAGKLQRGDIVVTTRGTIGNIAFYSESIPFEHVRINSGMMIFRANNDKWNRRFLYFLLTSSYIKQQIESLTSGSAVPQLPARDLKKFVLPDIPKNTQDSVEEIIGNLADKIELNRQTNQTLEHIAQALFKSWFVDFDPTRAKIDAKQAGEDPERAAMAAISGKTVDELDQLSSAQLEQLKTTAGLFPDALVDSELGEVPEGWGVKKIGECVKRFPVGKKFTQKTSKETGSIPVLDQGKSGIIGYHDEEPGVKASTSNPIVVFANHTCYMKLVMYDFSTIQNVLPFKGMNLDIFWIYEATYKKQEFIEYKGHWPDFSIQEILIPTKGLDKIFGELMKPLFVKKYEKEKEISTLSKLRDTLLPKLLSGELSTEPTEAVKNG